MMSFFGMGSFGALGSPEMFKAGLTAKPRGGLFGSGVSGEDLGQALGALGGGQQQEPLRHAQFAPMQFAPPPQFAPLPNYQGQGLPPLNLQHYFQQLGGY